MKLSWKFIHENNNNHFQINTDLLLLASAGCSAGPHIELFTGYLVALLTNNVVWQFNCYVTNLFFWELISRNESVKFSLCSTLLGQQLRMERISPAMTRYNRHRKEYWLETVHSIDHIFGRKLCLARLVDFH